MKPTIHSTAAVVTAGQYVKERDYWLETLDGDPLTEGFPYDEPPARAGAGAPAVLNFQWGGELRERLETVSTGLPRRLHVVLTAATALLLSRYQGHHDVVLGVTIFKQETDADFVNTVLPLRIAIDPRSTVKAFLMHVRRIIADAVENQNYPMDALLGKLNLVNEPHRFPLFDCAVLLESLHDHRYLGDLPLNMTISFEQEPQCLKGTVRYNPGAYKEDTVRRLIDHLECLLRAALTDLDAATASFELMDQEERRRVLVEFNRTEAPFAGDKTLHQLFREQVDKSGDCTAVVGTDAAATPVTYDQLNRQSDRLASALIEKGAGPETITAIMAERSVETIIGMLGILKTGGAYLPIDPEYPEDRIRYILSDSGANLVLGHPNQLTPLSELNEEVEIISLDQFNDKASQSLSIQHSEFNIQNSDPSGLAYIIYTSGSTGKPKGVMVEHRNAVNVTTWFARQYGVSNGVHVLGMSDFTFDPSVNQVFGSLLHGATLYMIDKEVLYDASRLRRFIDTHQIHILNFVPQVLNELLTGGGKLESVRFVLSGGEKLDDTVKSNVLAAGYRLVNQYGPTETTIDALAGSCSGERVNLGKPIDNTRVEILDRYGRPAPIGVPGELYISGAGVARGYLNRPELTAECFIQLNKSDKSDKTDKTNKTNETNRSYKTGDRVKWLPDGNVAFLGRIDHQVKIRGYRIELGEIEYRLMRYPGIAEAVVTTWETENDGTSLCAYFAPGDADIFQLREFLSTELPAYMVPFYFVPMAALPRTGAAKIDRKALPDPTDSLWSRRPFHPPTNETEDVIRRIWAEALDLEPDTIGIDDDFFQLGGNSINILKVQSQLNRLFGRELSMSHMFLNPTVRGLAADIGEEIFPPGLESMVRLNRGGKDLKNIFIIHPLHGMTYQFKELARLLEGRFNVIGIQSRGLVQETQLPASMKAMYLDYKEQIRGVQPEGPYLIVGFCMGNILGYELARELEDDGCTVEKMAVLDIRAFLSKSLVFKLRMRELVARLKRWLPRVDGGRKNPSPEIPIPTAADGEDHNEVVHQHNKKLMITYRPRRIIRSPLLVIKAEESSHPHLTKKAWRRMTRGAVTFLEVSGDHDSIFESPHVEKVADILKAGLTDDQ